MVENKLSNRVAVCSWSLEPENPSDLVAKLSAAGINRVQLALNPLRESPEIWEQTETALKQTGITLVSGMVGCIGEDYSSIESIRLTGGIAPDATWEQNLKNLRQDAALAARLGLNLVTFHAGFIPHEKSDVAAAKILSRLETVAEVFAAHRLVLGLETGQETAETLATVLSGLKTSNVGVNFDPANMILYDKGDPVEALRTLSPWLRQVHIKDATRTRIPGTWGSEVAVGTGEVNWQNFFTTLQELKFAGNLVIEREAGTQRVADIQAARELVLKNLGN